jgi:hypothetical protein
MNISFRPPPLKTKPPIMKNLLNTLWLTLNPHPVVSPLSWLLKPPGERLPPLQLLELRNKNRKPLSLLKLTELMTIRLRLKLRRRLKRLLRPPPLPRLRKTLPIKLLSLRPKSLRRKLKRKPLRLLPDLLVIRKLLRLKLSKPERLPLLLKPLPRKWKPLSSPTRRNLLKKRPELLERRLPRTRLLPLLPTPRSRKLRLTKPLLIRSRPSKKLRLVREELPLLLKKRLELPLLRPRKPELPLLKPPTSRPLPTR